MAYSTPNEAAEELGIHKATLRDMAKAGKFPAGAVLRTPGGHYRYDVEQIKGQLKQ